MNRRRPWTATNRKSTLRRVAASGCGGRGARSTLDGSAKVPQSCRFRPISSGRLLERSFLAAIGVWNPTCQWPGPEHMVSRTWEACLALEQRRAGKAARRGIGLAHQCAELL